MRYSLLLLALLLFPLADTRAAEPDVEALEEQAMRAAVAAVAPAVVRIETVGGLERVDKVLVGTGPTTGLVVSEDGYIVSSAFNFAQQPTSILVTLDGDTRLPAEIVARDHSRMLVLLKVNTAGKQLPVPAAADITALQVGEWAIAVGRTFEGDTPNVSVGIVSAKDRIFGKAVQTDAKISPSNYGGPLVDIHGHVIGVLVPMSAQGQGGEVAGVELYDGGIGFAVPLADLHKNLDKLKQGEDVHAGLLGIALKKGDPYDTPADVSLVSPGTPAAKAGIKGGDRVLAVDDRAVDTQMQLKLALGPRYAGETVQVTLLRDDEQLSYDIQLVESIKPFAHAFLGILPERNRLGRVPIRFVYPGSPAAKAGVAIDDIVVEVAGQAVTQPAEALEALASYIAGDVVPVAVERAGKRMELQLDSTQLPIDIPREIPPAEQPEEVFAGDAIQFGLREVKLPEFKNVCPLYVPKSYRADVPAGLIIWLHGPGGNDQDVLLARWKKLCEDHGLLLAMPAAEDANKWDRTEAEYLQKLLIALGDQYAIDPARTVLHGYQGGGEMAYKVALDNRPLVGGVAVVEAALPGRAGVPKNEPAERLAIYSAAAAMSADTMERMVKQFEDQNYPVTSITLDGKTRYLNAMELAALVRWVDSLDRF